MSAWIPAAALLVAATLVGCSRSAPEADRRTETIPPVEAVEARFGVLPLIERVSGTVWAENQVTLFPEVTARITAVYVQNGDTVEAGQPLVQLQDRQQREQVRQAEAGARIAEARVRQAQARLQESDAQQRRMATLGELVPELERESLRAQVESSRADLALAEAQLEQAQATVAEQQDQWEQFLVRAPIAGTVGERNAEVGLQVSPSSPLFTLGQTDRVQIRVQISDAVLPSIAAGQVVRIHLPPSATGARTLEARLTRVSPFLNPVTRSAAAHIEVNNTEGLLRPGFFVAVDLLHGESAPSTLVPASALYTDPNSGREGVFVVEAPASPLDTADTPADATARPAFSEPLPVNFRPTDIRARGDQVVAIAQLQAGDWVVTLGQDLLSTGRNEARVRSVSWEHALGLQSERREKLLDEALARPDAAPPSDS